MERLPNEVLYIVFGQLDPLSLNASVQVCRRWQSVIDKIFLKVKVRNLLGFCKTFHFPFGSNVSTLETVLLQNLRYKDCTLSLKRQNEVLSHTDSLLKNDELLYKLKWKQKPFAINLHITSGAAVLVTRFNSQVTIHNLLQSLISTPLSASIGDCSTKAVFKRTSNCLKYLRPFKKAQDVLKNNDRVVIASSRITYMIQKDDMSTVTATAGVADSTLDVLTAAAEKLNLQKPSEFRVKLNHTGEWLLLCKNFYKQTMKIPQITPEISIVPKNSSPREEFIITLIIANTQGSYANKLWMESSARWFGVETREGLSQRHWRDISDWSYSREKKLFTLSFMEPNSTLLRMEEVTAHANEEEALICNHLNSYFQSEDWINDWIENVLHLASSLKECLHSDEEELNKKELLQWCNGLMLRSMQLSSVCSRTVPRIDACKYSSTCECVERLVSVAKEIFDMNCKIFMVRTKTIRLKIAARSDLMNSLRLKKEAFKSAYQHLKIHTDVIYNHIILLQNKKQRN